MVCSSPPRRSPLFFKVFLPEHSSQRLMVPPAFVKKHIDNHSVVRTHNTVSLKGPGGGVWRTDLATDSGKVFLDKGWEEFVRDHSLQIGDFLVFRYEGGLCFHVVLVFDRFACEKEEALLARPSGGTKTKTGRLRLENTASDDCIVLEGPPSRKKKKNPTACKEDLFVLGVKRGPRFKSQRRAVTLQEVDSTLQKANAFKSEHRFFIVQMLDSSVYSSFTVRVPYCFSNKSKKKYATLNLRGPGGKCWQVKLISKIGRCGCLSAGWRNFSVENNLETADVCVFEEIKEYDMKVHIFRVVQEITPYIRVPAVLT